MPVETTEKQAAVSGETRPLDTPSTSENVPADHEVRQLASPPPDKRPMRRRLLIGALGALVLVALGIFGTPWLLTSLNTVSTDDAYVNDHVTFVAPQVAGQISRVLVENNNRVHKGQLLAQLDKEPFQQAVAVKKAAVETAAANLQAAKATVRDIEAQARARRWGLQNAVQDVKNKIALLHARVAALDKSKADLTLAQADFYRARQLLETAVGSRQEFDRAQRALSTASAQVTTRNTRATNRYNGRNLGSLFHESMSVIAHEAIDRSAWVVVLDRMRQIPAVRQSESRLSPAPSMANRHGSRQRAIETSS